MLKAKFDTSQLNKDLADFTKHVESSLDVTTKEVADVIKNEAKADDAVLPSIANSITTEKNNNGNGYLVKKGFGLPNPDEASWSEFGTGNFAAAQTAKEPSDWQAMAMEAFINGLGRTPARPSLYNAFVRNTANIADKAADKING